MTTYVTGSDGKRYKLVSASKPTSKNKYAKPSSPPQKPAKTHYAQTFFYGWLIGCLTPPTIIALYNIYKANGGAL